MFELLTARNCSTQPVWDCGGLPAYLRIRAKPTALRSQVLSDYWQCRHHCHV